MKKTLRTIIILLLLIAPLAAQENFEIKYSKKSIQKISPHNVIITRVDIKERYVRVYYETTNEINAADLASRITKSGFGKADLRALRKKTDINKKLIIYGYLDILVAKSSS